MKCPKCHYLSFDPEPRCRNCGYTLELVDADLAITPVGEDDDAPAPDLAFRAVSTDVTPDVPDLALRDDTASRAGWLTREPGDVAPGGGDVPLKGDDPLPKAGEALPGGRDLPRRRRRSAAARGPFDARDLALEAAREADGQALMDDGPIIDDADVFDADAASSDAEAPSIAAPSFEADAMSPNVADVNRPLSRTPAWSEDRLAGSAPARREPRRPEPAPVTTELPLFVKAMPADVDDADVDAHDREALAAALSAGAVTRAPDPVPAPEPVLRQRPADPPRKAGALDRDLLDGLARLEHGDRAVRRAAPGERVGVASRLGAAVIDGLLLGGLSAFLVWATLRWCGLPLSEARVLPILPTLAFLVVVGLGYLLLFTAAGGQTLGKMVCGIRVVDEAADALPLRQALYREVVALPSVLALGLGFFPALVGEERALHDRLAHTRVVRA